MMRSGSSSGNVDVVVVPLEKALFVKIEGLLGGVSGDTCRERHLKTAPGFAVLLPRLNFFGFDTGKGKEKWRIQIGPHRVSSEVRQLQAVPRRFQNVPLERLAWIESFLKNVAVACLDRHTVGLKRGLPICRSEG